MTWAAGCRKLWGHLQRGINKYNAREGTTAATDREEVVEEIFEEANVEQDGKFKAYAYSRDIPMLTHFSPDNMTQER